MPRPIKKRKICCNPDAKYFEPRGIPVKTLQEVSLTVEELESICLADFQNLYQEEAAKKMNISRQTFGNTINRAHQKIADALVNGKALRLERKE